MTPIDTPDFEAANRESEDLLAHLDDLAKQAGQKALEEHQAQRKFDPAAAIKRTRLILQEFLQD